MKVEDCLLDMLVESLLKKFLDYLKYEKKYSLLTIKNYERDINYFLYFLKDKKIFKITNVEYQDIRDYLVNLHNHQYSKKTISRYISSLRTFFKYLYMEGIIKNNPMLLVLNPKLDKKLPNFLYTKDLENLLTIPTSNNIYEIRDSLILELLYSTGIRVSELVNIKLKNINFNDKQIKIMGKGSKERYVMYGDICQNKLNKYLKNSRDILNVNQSEYLILNKNGEKITTRSIELLVKKYQKLADVKVNVTPHTLRHTFATHMLEGGADLKSVQELMGHESLSSTQVYTHITSERLRNVYLHTHPRAKKSN